MKSIFRTLCLGLGWLVLVASASLFAGEGRMQPLCKEVLRKEVGFSMVGPRSTLVFYACGRSSQVLKVELASSGQEPVIRAWLYRFPKETGLKGLGKWVNNQHSDGLFIDVPMPDQQVEMPAKQLEILQRKALEGESHRGRDYAVYQVKFRVSAQTGLEAFEDQATWRVRAE